MLVNPKSNEAQRVVRIPPKEVNDQEFNDKETDKILTTILHTHLDKGLRLRLLLVLLILPPT